MNHGQRRGNALVDIRCLNIAINEIYSFQWCCCIFELFNETNNAQRVVRIQSTTDIVTQHITHSYTAIISRKFIPIHFSSLRISCCRISSQIEFSRNAVAKCTVYTALPFQHLLTHHSQLTAFLLVVSSVNQ